MRILALTASLLFSVAGHSTAPAYKLITEIPITTDGGWDYLVVDESSHRLFVSHSDRVVVVDLNSGKVSGEIADTPGVHGIALAPDLNRAFISNGREGKVSVVDLKTLKTIKKVEVGINPDAIIYNPVEQEVYAFNGKSKSASILNAKTGAVVATVPLPGKPEFAAVDPVLHRVFVNIEDGNSIVALDSKSHKIVATYPIAPGEEASGMIIDAAHHRLFIGCHNKMMLSVDATSGKVIDHVAIGSGVDSNWYDSALKVALSSNGEGTVTFAEVNEAGKFSAPQTLTTKPRARTMALDTRTHRLYLPIADFRAMGKSKERPQPLPGTFKILVFGVDE